jgi:hypothetical protein
MITMVAVVSECVLCDYALRVQKKLRSKNGCVLKEVCAESKENVSHKEYSP